MTQIDSARVLSDLLDGNRRYLSGASLHPRQSAYRRAEISGGQQPFAAILTCSDSRVPPEIIFDCGLGDLFVIRVAGNVVDDVVLGSLEYAVESLGVRLIIVLGHTRCGAVAAAVQGGQLHGHMSSLTERIRPAVERATAFGANRVDAVVSANIEGVVKQLRTAQPILARLVAQGSLQIIGARYELETGQVKCLDA
jgi:carbonic anhydrase